MALLRIGLPKGVVLDRSIAVIERLLGCKALSRQLHFFASAEYRVHLLKHRDIPGLLRDGFLDVGVSSTEWVRETGVELMELRKLDWCDTRISLIAAIGSGVNELRSHHGPVVVTEFPRIAAGYVDSKQERIDIRVVSGSTESLVPWPFTFGIECVETGNTLRANGLREIDTILDAKTVCLIRKETRVETQLSRFLDSLSP